MTRDQVHDLKMAFIRQFQGAVPVKRRPEPRGPRRGKRAYRDQSRGEESLALSVHPKHVEVARDLTKRAGLSGIDFAPDGTAIISDEKHKWKYAEMTGHIDANSKNGS